MPWLQVNNDQLFSCNMVSWTQLIVSRPITHTRHQLSSLPMLVTMYGLATPEEMITHTVMKLLIQSKMQNSTITIHSKNLDNMMFQR